MFLWDLPFGILGFTKAKQASKGFDTRMFSFDRVNLSWLQASATPPPLLAPGRGVDTYLIPLSSDIDSMHFWCLLFSFFSQTSVRMLMSVDLISMFSAMLSHLDQADLTL